MKRYDAKLALDARAVLGEGPVWDQEEGFLYWVDIIPGQIHWFHPESGKDESVTLEKTVGAVALRAKGGLIAALSDGFYLVDMNMDRNRNRDKDRDRDIDKDKDKGKDKPSFHVSTVCLPGDILPGQRFNDGKCDPAGRFWAGTMQKEPLNPRCALYRLESDGKCISIVQGIGCSNGLAWSSDNKTMYYIDTATRCMDAFDYDIDMGRVSNRQRIVDFTSPAAITPDSPLAGHPDGMTIDAEGMLWVAEWRGYKVSRWNPSTGRKIGEVILPVSKVTSCTFGGPELTDLYITTASTELSPSEKAAEPLSGGIFCVATDTKGIAPVRFAG